MTEDEHQMIKRIDERVRAIEEKAEEQHAWLFRPPLTGGESRAQQLDDLMTGVRAGKLGARVFAYIAGALALFIGFKENVLSFLSQLGGGR